MKKDRWLSYALILAGTMHLLIFTHVIESAHDPLVDVLMSESILLTLVVPSIAANGLAVVFGHPFLILITSIAYFLTALVPMEGFVFLVIPGTFCLIDLGRVLINGFIIQTKSPAPDKMDLKGLLKSCLIRTGQKRREGDNDERHVWL